VAVFVQDYQAILEDTIRMNENTGRGLFRLASALIILSAFYYLAFVLNENLVEDILIWVEFKSAGPGLSGALIVFLGLSGFAGACFAVNWIAVGFKTRPN
jgi:hypothetical protein